MHIVLQRKTPDSPVYEVTAENEKSSKRVLHRNLLLPCDYLPVEEPVESAVPDVYPKKKTNQTIKQRETTTPPPSQKGRQNKAKVTQSVTMNSDTPCGVVK